MTYTWNKPQYHISAKWPTRPDEPNSIGARLQRYLDKLGGIDETLLDWSVGLRQKIDYPAPLPDLAARICGDIVYGEDGKKDVDAGYRLYCCTKLPKQIFTIRCATGAVYKQCLCNEFTFQTDNFSEMNPSVVTYRLMKAAMQAPISCWNPAYCLARSNQIAHDYKNEGYFTKAWMTYVPPAHADTVDLVGIPFSERIADGGLLLSATEDSFRPDNPVHLDGAARISRALQPLNATLPRF